MLLQRLNHFLIIATGLIVLIVLAFPHLLTYSYALFLVLIVAVGIPHGAIDHIIYFRNKSLSKESRLRFYVQYLGLAGVVALFWFLMPLTSFFLFLMVSAYHFGQSQLFYFKGPGLIRHLMYFFWGMLVLSCIIVFNYEECYLIFSSLEWLRIPSWMSIQLWSAVLGCCSLGLAGSLLAVAGVNDSFGRKLFFEMACLGCLILLAYLSNAVLSFSIYFGLWHSLKSLLLEYQTLRQSKLRFNLSKFILNLVPYSLLAVGFLALSYTITAQYALGLSPYMLFIIVISMLTLPHLIIMHDLFERGDSKSLA